MKRQYLTAICLALAAGCGAPEDDASAGDDPYGDNAKSDAVGAAAPGLKMPADIVAWERSQGWPDHHIEWHTERRWDLMAADDVKWATDQGWSRSPVQEGQATNGLAFLAMHRVMISTLEQNFPTRAALFAGWTTPPTNPKDSQSPLPNNATTRFDAQMKKAIDKIQNHIDEFESDDDFGLYLETNLRPVAGTPDTRSDDPTAGLHNYMHVRFQDPKSPIDVGDPTKNLYNQIFWRLHGWIDARWTAFRKVKGLKDSDPTYQAALTEAANHFSHHADGNDGATEQVPLGDIPASVMAIQFQ